MKGVEGEKYIQPCRSNIVQACRHRVRFSCAQKANVISVSVAYILVQLRSREKCFGGSVDAAVTRQHSALSLL